MTHADFVKKVHGATLNNQLHAGRLAQAIYEFVESKFQAISEVAPKTTGCAGCSGTAVAKDLALVKKQVNDVFADLSGQIDELSEKLNNSIDSSNDVESLEDSPLEVSSTKKIKIKAIQKAQ